MAGDRWGGFNALRVADRFGQAARAYAFDGKDAYIESHLNSAPSAETSAWGLSGPSLY